MIAMLLAALETPAACAGVSRVHRLLDKAAPLTIPELMAAQAEIAQELDELEGLRDRSRKAAERCTHLRPIPATRPPLGF
jgi:hypothetical protein